MFGCTQEHGYLFDADNKHLDLSWLSKVRFLPDGFRTLILNWIKPEMTYLSPSDLVYLCDAAFKCYGLLIPFKLVLQHLGMQLNVSSGEIALSK